MIPSFPFTSFSIWSSIRVLAFLLKWMLVYTAHCSRVQQAWTIQGTLPVHCTQGWLDAGCWLLVVSDLVCGVCPLCTVFTCPLSLPWWPGPQPRPGSGAAWAGADLRLRLHQTRFSLQCIIQLTRGLGPGTASLVGGVRIVTIVYRSPWRGEYCAIRLLIIIAEMLAVNQTWSEPRSM